MRYVSRLQVERHVRVPFSVAHDYAEDFFRAAEREIHVRLPLRDLIWTLRGRRGRPVRTLFALHPDDAEGGRVHDAMMIEWRAGTALFPDFHGTIRLRIASIETTRVTLEGAYRPPLGLFGRVFDTLFGRRMARAAFAELLVRLCQAMEHQEESYRAGLRPQSSGTLAEPPRSPAGHATNGGPAR